MSLQCPSRAKCFLEIEDQMKNWLSGAVLGVFLFVLVGCGESKTVMPEGELTEEQKAAIKAEDEQIDQEESEEA